MITSYINCVYDSYFFSVLTLSAIMIYVSVMLNIIRHMCIYKSISIIGKLILYLHTNGLMQNFKFPMDPREGFNGNHQGNLFVYPLQTASCYTRMQSSFFLSLSFSFSISL